MLAQNKNSSQKISDLLTCPAPSSFLITLRLNKKLLCPECGEPVLIVKNLDWILKRVNFINGDTKQILIKCDYCKQLHKIPSDMVELKISQ